MILDELFRVSQATGKPRASGDDPAIKRLATPHGA